MNALMGFQGIIILAVVLAVTVGIVLVIREVVCWYWKINISLEVQLSIEENLRLLNLRFDDKFADEAITSLKVLQRLKNKG